MELSAKIINDGLSKIAQSCAQGCYALWQWTTDHKVSTASAAVLGAAATYAASVYFATPTEPTMWEWIGLVKAEPTTWDLLAAQWENLAVLFGPVKPEPTTWETISSGAFALKDNYLAPAYAQLPSMQGTLSTAGGAIQGVFSFIDRFSPTTMDSFLPDASDIASNATGNATQGIIEQVVESVVPDMEICLAPWTTSPK